MDILQYYFTRSLLSSAAFIYKYYFLTAKIACSFFSNAGLPGSLSSANSTLYHIFLRTFFRSWRFSPIIYRSVTDIYLSGIKIYQVRWDDPERCNNNFKNEVKCCKNLQEKWSGGLENEMRKRDKGKISWEPDNLWRAEEGRNEGYQGKTLRDAQRYKEDYWMFEQTAFRSCPWELEARVLNCSSQSPFRRRRDWTWTQYGKKVPWKEKLHFCVYSSPAAECRTH